MCVLSELLTEVRKLVNGHGGGGHFTRYRRHTAVTEREIIGWEMLNRVGGRRAGKRIMDRDKNTNDLLRKSHRSLLLWKLPNICT